jgi:hypothetical protein
MKKNFLFLCATLICTMSLGQVRFLDIPINQSFDSFGEALCQKATLKDAHTNIFLGTRQATFIANFAGFYGCGVDVFENESHWMDNIWVILPAYEGTARVKQARLDYDNLVTSYKQKYGKSEVQYDTFDGDIVNTFLVGNIEISIGFYDFSKDDIGNEASIHIHYNILSGRKIDNRDI